MFVIVLFLSLLLLYLPQTATNLMASSQNILGVVTSIFVHKDVTHLGVNMLIAFSALLFYSLASSISGIRNESFTIVTIWISAILANLAYVLIYPNSRVGGSSGLVSAFLASIATFAYINAWTQTVQRHRIVQSLIGTYLFAVFIVLNLNTSPDTNVIVHLLSFFIAVFLVMTFQWRVK
jgi:membrane associated rhomboid family serine protease